MISQSLEAGAWRFIHRGEVDDVMGEAILTLSKMLVGRGRYKGFSHSWKEEMSDAATLAIIKALPSFDPRRGKAVAFLAVSGIRGIENYLRKEKREWRKVEEYKEIVRMMGREGEVWFKNWEDEG